MQYVCLVFCEPGVFERMTPKEQKTLDRDSLGYNDELKRSGRFLHANALQSTDNAVTVRMRSSRMSTTDGPFAETKEHLCGFVLIDAADRDAAIRVASGIPLAKYGSIEVRPIYDIPDPDA